MATIRDALAAKSNPSPLNESPPAAAPAPAGSAPLDVPGKIARLVTEFEAATGKKLNHGENHIGFVLEDGREVRCEVRDGFSLLITATVDKLSPEKLKEIAPVLLQANVFGNGTGGGWLAFDLASQSLLFHYQWVDFYVASTESFAQLMEIILGMSERLRTIINGGDWDAFTEFSVTEDE